MSSLRDFLKRSKRFPGLTPAANSCRHFVAEMLKSKYHWPMPKRLIKSTSLHRRSWTDLPVVAIHNHLQDKIPGKEYG
jgi:hypothetical protein